jgi:hypothetical protein
MAIDDQRPKHYTAVLKIYRVDEAIPADPNRRTPKIEKDTTEVTSINLRNSELEPLLDKLTKHVALIEEN